MEAQKRAAVDAIIKAGLDDTDMRDDERGSGADVLRRAASRFPTFSVYYRAVGAEYVGLTVEPRLGHGGQLTLGTFVATSLSSPPDVAIATAVLLQRVAGVAKAVEQAIAEAAA